MWQRSSWCLVLESLHADNHVCGNAPQAMQQERSLSFFFPWALYGGFGLPPRLCPVFTFACGRHGSCTRMRQAAS